MLRVTSSGYFKIKHKIIKMSVIVPYNFKFPKHNSYTSPNDLRKNFQNIKLSKDAQRIRDISYNLAPIPSFGVEDNRPQTDGELKAMINPVMITEPLQQKYENKPNEFSLNTNGENVLNYDFQEIPINGMPNINM